MKFWNKNKKKDIEKEIDIEVSASGVSVSGKGEKLKDIEELTDRLIKKHSKFMEVKKVNQRRLGIG